MSKNYSKLHRNTNVSCGGLTSYRQFLLIVRLTACLLYKTIVYFFLNFAISTSFHFYHLNTFLTTIKIRNKNSTI